MNYLKNFISLVIIISNVHSENLLLINPINYRNNIYKTKNVIMNKHESKLLQKIIII